MLYTHSDLPEIHRTNVAVFGGKRPSHTRKRRSRGSSKPQLTSHGPDRAVKTRGRPRGHGGRRSNSSNTPHIMGSGQGRPVNAYRPPHGPGGPAHIEATSFGPRPGTAH